MVVPMRLFLRFIIAVHLFQTIFHAPLCQLPVGRYKVTGPGPVYRGSGRERSVEPVWRVCGDGGEVRVV
jgi:hypothetical protein